MLKPGLDDFEHYFAHKLELDEVRKYLAEDNMAYVKKRRFVGGKPTVVSSYSTSTNNGGVVSTITVNTTMPENVALNDEIVLRGLNKALTVEEAQRLQHNTLKIRAKYQRDVLDEVLFHMLDNAGKLPLKSYR